MNCPDKEALSAYLDGEAEAPEARALAAHMEECSPCRSRINVLKALKAAVSAAVPVPPMPDDLRRALQGMVRRPEPWWKRIIEEAGAGLMRPAAALSFSMAAVLALTWVVRNRRDERRLDELPVETLLAAHNQYALTMPLAAEERIIAELPVESDDDSAGGADAL